MEKEKNTAQCISLTYKNISESKHLWKPYEKPYFSKTMDMEQR